MKKKCSYYLIHFFNYSLLNRVVRFQRFINVMMLHDPSFSSWNLKTFLRYRSLNSNDKIRKSNDKMLFIRVHNLLQLYFITLYIKHFLMSIYVTVFIISFIVI